MMYDVVFSLTDIDLLKFAMWCIIEWGARYINHIALLIVALMLALLTVVLLGCIAEGLQPKCKS